MSPKYHFGLCYSCIHIALLTMGMAYAQPHNSRAWYVDNTGNDAGTGSMEAPLKTLSKINTLDLRAGDTVYFHSGQTFEGTLELKVAIAGTKVKPVVITSYGRGRAVIDAKDSSGVRLY